MNRAALAGQLLAHVLASGAHGERPVTLIGYSMGARCACALYLPRKRCICHVTKDGMLLPWHKKWERVF